MQYTSTMINIWFLSLSLAIISTIVIVYQILLRKVRAVHHPFNHISPLFPCCFLRRPCASTCTLCMTLFPAHWLKLYRLNIPNTTVIHTTGRIFEIYILYLDTKFYLYSNDSNEQFPKLNYWWHKCEVSAY